MIKCKADRDKNYFKIKVSGNLRYILTETLGIVSTIYDGLKEKNPEIADEYKRILQESIIDPQSPVFTEKYFE